MGTVFYTMGGDEGDINVGGNIAGSFAFGTVIGAAKEAWTMGTIGKPQINVAEVAHGIGKSSLQFAVLGGLYSFGAVIAKGARDKDDSLNYGLGGAFAGIFLGMRAKSLHAVVLKGVTLAGAGVACSFLAGKFNGNPRKADAELIQRFAYTSAADGKK